MARKYDLIIFDCDGTLVDSEPITNKVIATMLQELGLDVSQSESLLLFAGKTLKDIIDYIKHHGISIEENVFVGEYRQRCDEALGRTLEPIRGVVGLLESLPIPYCIASNGPQNKMRVSLPAAGILKYFSDETIFSAYDIGSWKPDPELFHHAALQMSTPQSKCLVIEDTWSGVMGALNGGMDVFAYNPHIDRRLYLDGVPNFSSMAHLRVELLRLLEEPLLG